MTSTQKWKLFAAAKQRIVFTRTFSSRVCKNTAVRFESLSRSDSSWTRSSVYGFSTSCKPWQIAQRYRPRGTPVLPESDIHNNKIHWKFPLQSISLFANNNLASNGSQLASPEIIYCNRIYRLTEQNGMIWRNCQRLEINWFFATCSRRGAMKPNEVNKLSIMCGKLAQAIQQTRFRLMYEGKLIRKLQKHDIQVSMLLYTGQHSCTVREIVQLSIRGALHYALIYIQFVQMGNDGHFWQLFQRQFSAFNW